MRLRILLLPLLLALPGVARSLEDDRFLPEDWIYTQEPTHPRYWGVDWGITSFTLPYRVLKRGKHYAEARWANNWRFGGETGGFWGGFLRLVEGTLLDYGMFQGLQNLHHQLGHDAAARELSRDYGLGSVPSRFGQVLPKLISGGGPLKDDERRTFGGADANTYYLVLPMQAEMHASYAAGKTILAGEHVNVTQVSDFLVYRWRFLEDRLSEVGTVTQEYIDFQSTGTKTAAQYAKFGPHTEFSTDFTNYVVGLNRNRYGQTRLENYRFGMDDIKRGYLISLLDPVLWAALWSYSKDYIGGARNQTSLPMFSLEGGVRYLPGLRVYFTPFGVDFYQDNYFARKGVLANIFWSKGDDKYEERLGAGFEVENIPFWGHAVAGLYGQWSRQPLLSRILDRSALSAGEVGLRHDVYDVGGSIQLPVWTWGDGADPARLFLYARGGTKNDGWIPGRYLKGGSYLQTGLGVHW